MGVCVSVSVCVLCPGLQNSQRRWGGPGSAIPPHASIKTFYTAPDCWKLSKSDVLNKYFLAPSDFFFLNRNKTKQNQPITLAYLSLSTRTQQS